jgi:hypothetical protein
MSDAADPPFKRYLEFARDADVVGAMRGQLGEIASLIGGISEDEGGRLHPPYTWTIKQVVGHVIDTERVFGYRAMRFSRGDGTELPGFDQDLFVEWGGFEKRTLGDLIGEFEAVRRGHLLMFENLQDGAWEMTGRAAGWEWTVENLARAMVGHVRHHVGIVRQRIGKAGY